MDQFGGYELLERLGGGSMAEVFKARLTRAEGFEKLVVVKRILPHLSEDPEFVRMFIAEAKLAATLDHANIVRVSDFGLVDGQPFLVMELVQGLDLREVLRCSHDFSRPIQVPEAVLITSAVAAGLSHAHGDLTGAPAVIHRDVSPHNILLSKTGEVKLADFGVAKLAGTDHGTNALGALKGKIRYASPEQLRGEDLDGRSDIFSLGVVLWELLSGRLLFTNSSDVAVIEHRHSCRRPEPPSKINPAVPKELDQVVLRCLEESPAHRFAKSSELINALDSLPIAFTKARPAILAAFCNEILNHRSHTIASVQVNSTPRTPRRRRPLNTALVITGLTALSAVVALGFYWRDHTTMTEEATSTSSAPTAPASSPPAVEESPPAAAIADESLPPAHDSAPPPETTTAAVPSQPATPKRRPPKPPAPAEKKQGLPASLFQPGNIKIPELTGDQTAAKEGTVIIDSEPSTEVSLKGVLLGKTPIEKRLPPGEHTFLIGTFRDFTSFEVSIREGAVYRVRFKLDGEKWVRALN